MKQKLKILSVSPNQESLPVFLRLNIYRGRYATEGSLLELKDGVTPFFIRFFPKNNDQIDLFENSFELIRTQLLLEKRRISKEYLVANFWIYQIPDFGNQSLSPGFEDFITLAFDENGYKLPQSRVAYIKNYTTKEVYMLLDKSFYPTEINLDIAIEEKNYYNSDSDYISVSKTSGVFKINPKNQLGNLVRQIDTLGEIEVYVREGVSPNFSYFRLDNSDYFINIENEFDFPQNANPVFVQEQGTEFRSGLQRKEAFDNNIIINPKLKTIDTIYIKTKDHKLTFYSNQYSAISTKFRVELTDDVLLFKKTENGFIKLIQGLEYYVSNNQIVNNNQIVIPGSDGADFFEVYVRSTSDKGLSMAFDVASQTSFNIINTLYDNNINDWNIDLNKSSILVFKNGLLNAVGNKSTGYSAGRYEYYIANSVLNNSLKTSFVEPSTDDVIPLLTNSNSFDNFNKYQISTDPNFVTYGETNPTNISNQEVYLYDERLKFKIDDKEPKVNISGGTYTVQGIPNSYVLDDLTPVYNDLLAYQNTELADFLQENVNVQNIEADIAMLKKNLTAIINNSGQLSYTDITASTINSNFMFMVIKDIAGEFDITYYNGNNIVKKEYSCECGIDNKYISLPYFTFTGFKIDNGTGGKYYTFK
jgi:hypothetical protein